MKYSIWFSVALFSGVLLGFGACERQGQERPEQPSGYQEPTVDAGQDNLSADLDNDSPESYSSGTTGAVAAGGSTAVPPGAERNNMNATASATASATSGVGGMRSTASTTGGARTSRLHGAGGTGGSRGAGGTSVR